MTSEDLVFGIHAVQALVTERPDDIALLWLATERDDQRVTDLLKTAEASGVRLKQVPRRVLDGMVSGVHQGVVARRARSVTGSEKDLRALLEANPHPFLLVLDGVQDPHNLGACLRSAEAAGVDAVIWPRAHSAPLGGATCKAASGAVERLALFEVSNLARTLEALKSAGVWLMGLEAGSAESLYGVDLRGPLALVLGSEGDGLRALTRSHCDRLLSIPLKGKAESLNLSVAAGVCLFEAARQRVVTATNR